MANLYLEICRDFVDTIIIGYILTPIFYILLLPFYIFFWIYDLFTHKQVEDPKCVLITGASSGIGEALAKYYAGHSAEVLYIFGTNEERLNNTKEECLKVNSNLNIFTYVGDITNETVFNKQIKDIADKNTVDLVIANAGRGIISTLTSESLMNDADATFKLNILACCHTILPFVDSMIKRCSGQLCVISSVNGYGNLCSAPSYESSKNCVRVYFEGLLQRLRPYNVHVNIVSPGPVDTRFSENQSAFPLCSTSTYAAEYIAEQLKNNIPYISFPKFYHVVFYTLGRQIPSSILYYIMSFMNSTKKN